MDSYRKQSELLVGPALDRLRQGDPEVVAFLYQHYTYLHADVQFMVFRAIWERLSSSHDEALARRLRDLGIGDLATDFPRMAGTMRQWSDRIWTAAAMELTRPVLADIHARSPRAVALRHLVVGLPLSAILGAKLRRGMGVLMERWPALSVSRDGIVAWSRAALKRRWSAGKRRAQRTKPARGQVRSRRRP